MYSVRDYLGMIGDQRRFEAYATALRQAVTPGSLVVEVGTGIGVFAVLARRFGARRVIAIEPNDAIAVAELVARENAVDNIDFIHAPAEEVVVSEQADVVVADLRGALPVAGTYLETMIDVRRRFLRPGGTLIPAVDHLCIAVARTPRDYEDLHPTCATDGSRVTLDVVERFAVNAWTKEAHLEHDNLLTAPGTWASIDYRTLDDPNVAGHTTLTVNQAGVGHGLVVWFDGTLSDGVVVPNGLDQPGTAWGRMFFPFEAPVELQEGDQVDLGLRAKYVARDYVWSWDTDVRPADVSKGKKARFRQSTFYGIPISADKLKLGAAESAPRLGENGQIVRYVLHAMDGRTSNDEIARGLIDTFPHRFQTVTAALGRVGKVARTFAEIR